MKFSEMRFLEETLRVMRTHREGSPLFSNMIAAEIFEAKYTRAPYRILPRTDGGFVVIDERLTVGSRTVSRHRSPDEALAHIVKVLEPAQATEAA